MFWIRHESGNICSSVNIISSSHCVWVIVNKLHRKRWSVSARPTTYQPPTDHLPITYQPPNHRPLTDHIPTTYRPLTEYVPTTYQPHTDHIPNTYRPHTEYVPTTYRPHTDHIPTTFYGAACLQLPCVWAVNFIKNLICKLR